MYHLALLCRSKGSKLNISKIRGLTPKLPVRWSSSHQASSQQDYQVGDVVHGYRLEKVDHIKELNIRPYLFKHEVTGTRHLHLAKDDDNNVFTVTMRTVPKDSTGVAHILEHLALCGSAKYPVRDPFFKMTTRSLATMMNAFTGPDFTAYPFSTQNKKDFENLLGVYLDAVFFPRLRPVDFRQEGWRLQHEKPDKKDTPIIISGVVYNEMKGAFSSTDAIYSRQLLNSIFTDNTYQYESGGDPEKIPDLTHSDVKKFHELHYHPSNAQFFTYGDIPIAEHLKTINEMVLSKFSENSLARDSSSVQLQELWQRSRTVNITGPSDPLATKPESQVTTSISYLLPVENANHHDIFAINVLSTLLTSGQSAPFHKNLFESEYGTDYSPSYGLHGYTRQPFFSVGLKGLREDEISKVHKIIEDTFASAAEEGFPQWRIDAILHDIELGLKHIRGNAGLRIFFNLEPHWLHEGDPIDCLKVNDYVNKFKENLASDKSYWKVLIEKYFLKNNHKLILNMMPDVEFARKRKQREDSILEAKLSKLNDVDRQSILYEGMELEKIQNTKQDSSVLPCLEPSKDIPKELKYRVNPMIESHHGVEAQFYEQPTNEVVYLNGLIDISGITRAEDLVDYLPLFCSVATSLGAGSYNRQKLDEKISLTTGGLDISFMSNPSLSKYGEFKPKVMFSSFCLRRNVPAMLDLWTNVFKGIHFDDNRKYLADRIKSRASEIAESVAHAGSMYALKRAAKGLGKINEYDERLSGLTHVARMKDIASQESIDSISRKLQAIAEVIFDPKSIKYAIHAEPDAIEPVRDEVSKFLEMIQEKSIYSGRTHHIPDENYERTKVDDLKFPFATHFVAKCQHGTTFLHEDYAKISIASKLISSKYFLPELREKGGAYGAKCELLESGAIGMFTYRDPNTDKTLNVFDQAYDWARDESNYSDRDIEESKLAQFQNVDRPTGPGQRGLGLFVRGLTDDMRQDYRQRLLQVKRHDIKLVAEKYLNQKETGKCVL